MSFLDSFSGDFGNLFSDATSNFDWSNIDPSAFLSAPGGLFDSFDPSSAFSGGAWTNALSGIDPSFGTGGFDWSGTNLNIDPNATWSQILGNTPDPSFGAGGTDWNNLLGGAAGAVPRVLAATGAGGGVPQQPRTAVPGQPQAQGRPGTIPGTPQTAPQGGVGGLLNNFLGGGGLGSLLGAGGALAGLMKGNGPLPYQQNMLDLAKQGVDYTNQLLPTALANQQGNISGPALDTIERKLARNEAGTRGAYAGMGLSGSSMEQEDLADLRAKAADQVFQTGQQMATTGFNEAAALSGQAEGIYKDLMDEQIKQDQELTNQLGQFAQLLGSSLSTAFKPQATTPASNPSFLPGGTGIPTDPLSAITGGGFPTGAIDSILSGIDVNSLFGSPQTPTMPISGLPATSLVDTSAYGTPDFTGAPPTRSPLDGIDLNAIFGAQ